MPRRPRSASRAAPKKNATVTGAAFKPKSVPTPKSAPVSGPEQSEDEDGDEEPNQEVDDDESSAEESVLGGDDDDDVDAPRVSQWVDDDDLDPTLYQSDDDAPEQTNGAGPSQLKSLEDDLSNLPLGALLRAQRALKQANASDSESENSSDDESPPKPESTSLKGKEKEKAKPEWSIEPRHDIAKRTHKHAPVEVTSKRPVTRRRTVVEVKTLQPRDPRFLPLAGEFLPEKFQAQYGFLADAHKNELRTLRENLKAARKLLVSSPRDLRAEREAEVGRLEMAVKRAESLVNKDRRAKVDQEALTKLNEAERAKRKEGKGGWWMKESDKKEFLVRARYDALAAEGGKRAVKKAIEKKQKKIGQKEKRSRPFAKDSGLKRKSGAGDGDGGPAQKRRRV
ncbi:hypothetical protein B0H17DRAFT_1036258 [Mycena rosella]|uniref:rRNA biogenesis protein RRP36 n=1 Tax=Mycena rosella TaxID=1033263 RepID=A0AAD7GVV3_MYCRO|nr:hypothetical protein B0H17DRAFT_1036258 [Mycena rosella]